MDEQMGQPQSAPQGAPQGTPQVHKVEHVKAMSILAYLGILIVIPFIMAKDNQTVKFHIKQGAVLFVVELIVWALGWTTIGWELWPILQLINLAVAILAIIGIINAVKGRQQELPLVGSFAHYFTF